MLILFYLIFTPVGLIVRLIGRDALQRRFDGQAKTYWSPLEIDIPAKRYFRQF